jgi:hypothetical protein
MANNFVKTNAGKAINAARKMGNTQPVPAWVGWGTGAGTSVAGDVALFTEAPEARVLGTLSLETTTVPNDTVLLSALLTAAAAETITNAGSFDASVKTGAGAGVIDIKGDFSGVPLAAGESILFQITDQFQ